MTSMTRKLFVLPVVAAVSSLGACSSAGPSGPATGGASQPAGARAGTPLTVVASTNVWGDVAKQIGGDNVQVSSMITNPDADPHEYEASARNQLSLARARVVIENGGGYDDFIDRMLKSANNDTATVLNAVSISGKTAANGRELNEHVWYDFGTVQKVVDKIQDSYAIADPADASIFSRNARTLKQQVSNLEQRERKLKRSYAGDPVAITEPVPVYLLDAIGLKDQTPEAFSEAIEEDSDVSARTLNAALKLYSTHQVDLLAYNQQTSGPETEKVLIAAQQNGIPTVPVTETLPEGKNYIGWMSDNLNAFGAALGKATSTAGQDN